MYPTPAGELDPMMAVVFHELGHSLIACESKMRTRWTSIRRSWLTGTVSGYTEVACEDFDSAELRSALLLIVAGMSATSIWVQREHQWPARQANCYGFGTGCDDRKMFRFYSRGTQYTLDRARREVSGILTAQWPRIERASGVLYRRRKVHAEKLVGKGA